MEFENEYIESLINKFMRTAYWAMYKMNVSEKEIGKFVLTSINEISMRYGNKICIEYSVGDIVDCNYGFHLTGEVNGGHIPAIVCNIIKGSRMAYLVPIIAAQENLTSLSYLTFSVQEDMICYNKFYGGTVLLGKGKYVRAERLNAVVGKATPEFFAKVLKQLSTTFDFTSNAAMSVFKPEKTNKNLVSAEFALLNLISDSLEKLDSTKPVEEQVETFLTNIGMTTTEKIVTQSFDIACNIEKINYENVIPKLHNRFPEVKKSTIKTILRDNFKIWLNDVHPELVEVCPTISFMSVLKLFAKRFV